MKKFICILLSLLIYPLFLASPDADASTGTVAPSLKAYLLKTGKPDGTELDLNNDGKINVLDFCRSKTIYLSTAGQVFLLINEIRVKNGLSELKQLENLNSAAQTRANELVIAYNSDHTRPDGSSCFTILAEQGISYRAYGENIAAGYSNPKSVVDAWMSSSGHRANILNKSFTHLGVGYAYNSNSRYRFYWAQEFIGTIR